MLQWQGLRDTRCHVLSSIVGIYISESLGRPRPSDQPCYVFTRLASASCDNTLRLWDVESGQSIGDALKGHINNVHHVVFSPDRRKFASALSDGTLALWDVENGRPIGNALKGHTSCINHVVYSFSFQSSCKKTDGCYGCIDFIMVRGV